MALEFGSEEILIIESEDVLLGIIYVQDLSNDLSELTIIVRGQT